MGKKYLLASRPGGGCCTCAQQVGCNCGQCNLRCRSKTGIAELCGYSEYVTPSVPPRKFRRKTMGGSLTLSAAPPSCLKFGTWTGVFSGDCWFDPVTCVHHPDARMTVTGICFNCTGEPGAGTYVQCGLPGFGGLNPPAEAQLSRVTSNPSPGLPCWTGTVSEVLTEEDTEGDAMERAAGDSVPWILAETCAQVSSYVANRGAGQFQFGFRQAQFGISLAGLVVGQTYDFTVKFGERVYGTNDPYQYLGREYFTSITIDPGDDWSEWIDVPFQRGLEIRPIECAMEQE